MPVQHLGLGELVVAVRRGLGQRQQSPVAQHMRERQAKLKEKGMGGFGKFLAVFFSVICIGAALGGGNSFQVQAD